MLLSQIGSKNIKCQRGLSIIEILVVIIIITIALVSILSLVTFSFRVSTLIKETTQANALAQETIEAVRNFRDGTDWNNDDPQNKYDGLGVATVGVAYYPEKSTDALPKWMLLQGEEEINGFTRKVVFNDVYRDITTDDIETSGGYFDPDTKKVTVTISWKSRKVEIITYLTNWKE